MNIIRINISRIIQPINTDEAVNKKPYRAMLASVEPEFLKELMRYAKGNKSKAAKHAGIDRSTLRRKLDYYGIEVKK